MYFTAIQWKSKFNFFAENAQPSDVFRPAWKGLTTEFGVTALCVFSNYTFVLQLFNRRFTLPMHIAFQTPGVESEVRNNHIVIAMSTWQVDKPELGKAKGTMYKSLPLTHLQTRRMMSGRKMWDISITNRI